MHKIIKIINLLRFPIDLLANVEKKIKEKFTIFNNNKFIIFLLIVFLFEPAIIKEKSKIIHYFYVIMQMLSFFTIVYKYVHVKRKLNKFEIFILLYGIVLCISSALSSEGKIIIAIISVIKLFSITLIMQYFCKKDVHSLVKVMSTIFEVLIYINFLTVIIFKDGMYYINGFTSVTTYWFLGHDNQFFKYMINGCCLALIHCKINPEVKSNRFRTCLIFFISVLTLAIRYSLTSLISMIVYMILLAFVFIIKNYKNIIKPAYYAWCYIAIYISVVFVRILDNFPNLLKGLFNRKVTFSGRVYLWDYTIQYIKNSIFFGYGMEPDCVRLQKYKESNVHGAINSHNIFLEIAYQGGIILLGLFIVILLLSIAELNKNRNNIISHILIITIFTMFIVLLMEVYAIHFIVIPLILAYNVREILLEKKERNV